ncbi:MAG: hypothetical protein QW250_07405, partial [Sulfolobaceae archaeon]
KIITPFTADFLAAYTIYSAITGEFRYSQFIDYEVIVNEKIKLYQPFYNITLSELNVIEEVKILNTGDLLFDKIYSWILSNLKDSEELLRSFRNSSLLIKPFISKKCKKCGANINDINSEYCENCTTLVTSFFQS